MARICVQCLTWCEKRGRAVNCSEPIIPHSNGIEFSHNKVLRLPGSVAIGT